MLIALSSKPTRLLLPQWRRVKPKISVRINPKLYLTNVVTQTICSGEAFTLTPEYYAASYWQEGLIQLLTGLDKQSMEFLTLLILEQVQ